MADMRQDGFIALSPEPDRPLAFDTSGQEFCDSRQGPARTEEDRLAGCY
jgi:hypothetical protein